MDKNRFAVSVRHDRPARVVVRLAGGPGVAERQFQPLEAADLSGKLMAAAVELLVGDDSLGVPAQSVGHVILWENWGTPDDGASWCPQFLRSVRELQANVARCREDGTPYIVTLPMLSDTPKEPTAEKEADDVPMDP